MKFYVLIITCITLAMGCNKKENFVLSKSGVYGIDVSHHQGRINWSQVKRWKNKQISFVYIKATEGATFIDNRYKINFKEAKQAGFRVGSYHYFSTTSSPEQQFKNFMRQVDPRAQDIIPMIDLEENKNWSKEEYVSNLKIFLHLIEEQFKSKPLLYSVQGFYNTYIRNDFNSYHWNIARYNIKKPHLLDKNRWSLWQFSDKERIKGIKKYVDLNLIRNNLKIDIIMLNN